MNTGANPFSIAAAGAVAAVAAVVVGHLTVATAPPSAPTKEGTDAADERVRGGPAVAWSSISLASEHASELSGLYERTSWTVNGAPVFRSSRGVICRSATTGAWVVAHICEAFLCDGGLCEPALRRAFRDWGQLRFFSEAEEEDAPFRGYALERPTSEGWTPAEAAGYAFVYADRSMRTY